MLPSFHAFTARALKSVYGSNILNYYTHPAHFAATTLRYTFLGFRLKFTTGQCCAHTVVAYGQCRAERPYNPQRAGGRLGVHFWNSQWARGF